MPLDLNRFIGMVVKIHREIKARRQSTISRWSRLETVVGASASLAASFLVCCSTIERSGNVEEVLRKVDNRFHAGYSVLAWGNYKYKNTW